MTIILRSAKKLSQNCNRIPVLCSALCSSIKQNRFSDAAVMKYHVTCFGGWSGGAMVVDKTSSAGPSD